MLVERDDLLATIHRLIDAAAAGDGGALLLEGEAGLGKTSLVGAAQAHAEAVGVRVLRAAAGEIEQDLPWGVVRDLLRRPVQGHREDLAAVAAGALGLGGSTPSDAFSPLQPLTDACLQLAEHSPIVLLVDDAHWCDIESAQWLAHLSLRLTAMPVSLLVAARPSDVRRPQALTLLAVRARTETLKPLTRAGATALVRSAVPVADDTLSAACYESTAGNHFLLTELVYELRSVADPAPDVVERLSVAAVDQALRRKLTSAGRDATRLAQAVSVLGADAASYDAVVLAGLDRASGVAAADALRASGLLDDCGLGRLAFAHPLYKAATNRSLPSGARSLLHLAAARHLDATGAPIEIIGAQLLHVEPAGDGWVQERLIRAAESARCAGALSAVRGLLERAAAERVGPRDPDLLCKVGEATLALDPPAAVQPLRTALSLTTDIRQRAAVSLHLANALQGAGRLDELLPLLIELSDDLEHSGVNEPIWWRVEGELLAQASLFPPARELRRTRLARAADRLKGEHTEESLILLQLAVDECGGNASTGREMAERAWNTGLLSATGGLVSPAAQWLFYCLAYFDAPQLGERIAHQWWTDVQRRGGGAEATYACAILAEMQVRRGALREAEASAAAGWAIAQEVGRGFAGWWLTCGSLAQALLRRGHSGRARDLLEENGLLSGTAPLIWMMPCPAVVRAEVLIASGDIARGVEELHALDDWLQALNMPSPGAWWYPASLVDGLLLRNEPEKAQLVAEGWQNDVAAFSSPTVSGIAARTVGIARQSVDCLREGETLLRHSPARGEHARALLELGAALRRGNARAAARDKLREALELAQSCGAEALADRAAVELRAAGGSVRRGVHGVDALTASELRVAQLAAQGMSNPQIAAALFITRKTVEKHLAGAFDKLGVASRHALPVALHAREE